MAHYEMYKRDATNKCADCGKQNREVGDKEWVIDYRNSPGWKPGDTAREYLCLNCGDKINQHNIDEENERIRRNKEKEESAIAKEAEEIPAELRKLWDDLELKVKDEDLEVKDVKRIYALKNKINEFLKEAKSIDINSDYWVKIEINRKLFQESPTKLDNFVKENASPQTIDKVNGLKERKTRCAEHENIEPCTDDPTFFCCSYCWDTSSPEFLKRLSWWHVSKIDKLLNEHNIHITEFLNNSNYSKLLYKNTFNTQKELKAVYQATEKDLQSLLKSKGVDIDKDRERERERAKIQSAITNLENKSDKTPEEEEELDELKGKLKDLDRKQESPSTSYLPWIIGGSCLVVVLVLIVFVATFQKRKRTW